MAALQERNGSYRVLFRYQDKQHTFTLGKVSEKTAEGKRLRVEELLRLVENQTLEVAPETDIVEFIRFDGKPPKKATEADLKRTTLAQLKDAYLAAHGDGAVEKNTLVTLKVHFAHLVESLGTKFVMNGLTLEDLQGHVNRRQKTVAPVTIKKELATLKTAWVWGSSMNHIAGKFPAGKLVFRKEDEKLPFMTWDEIERRVKGGGDASTLWECLYLDTEQVSQFLAFAKSAKGPNWLYPMFCTAAHTGMRRSELVRAKVEDVDFSVGVITVREKKRVRGRLTTRRVPMTEFLTNLLREWINSRPGSVFLFGKGKTALSAQVVQELFRAAVDDTKWAVLHGFHTLRHSFVSACASKSIDQRLLQEWCGHMDEKTSRRYRHLYPSTQREAIKLVFAPAAVHPAGSEEAPRG